MKPNLRVLWVEDEARQGYETLAPHVVLAGYDLDVAEDASSCEILISRTEYAAVVIDIRIPPGTDPRWIALYETHDSDPYRARLGSALVATILGLPGAQVVAKRPRPTWLGPERVGVISVETYQDLQDLRDLGITVTRQKQADTPGTVLLDVITELIEQTANAKREGRS